MKKISLHFLIIFCHLCKSLTNEKTPANIGRKRTQRQYHAEFYNRNLHQLLQQTCINFCNSRQRKKRTPRSEETSESSSRRKKQTRGGRGKYDLRFQPSAYLLSGFLLLIVARPVSLEVSPAVLSFGTPIESAGLEPAFREVSPRTLPWLELTAHLQNPSLEVKVALHLLANLRNNLVNRILRNELAH